MKAFGDPNVYPDAHFNGYAMGGQNACDVHLILKRIVTLMHDGLLEKGLHDWMHILGTGKLEWAGVLTAIQRGVRKLYNENFTISFDCASPFLAVSNGTQYSGYRLEHEGKWSYLMEPAPDDKALHNDTTPYDDYCDKLYENWMPSPLSKMMKVNDVTRYSPTCANRMGDITKTSWDSFSYCLMMAHNVYNQIRAVQVANDFNDIERVVHKPDVKHWRKTKASDTTDEHSTYVPRNILYFNTLVEQVFTSEKPMEVIANASSFLADIRGNRWARATGGSKGTNNFSSLFE